MKLIPILLFLITYLNWSPQDSNNHCTELLISKSKTLLSKDYELADEKKIVDELLACKDFSISKDELLDILGEPDDLGFYYDGNEDEYYSTFEYYLKPTYESDFFIGRALQFPFKANSNVSLTIDVINYCG